MNLKSLLSTKAFIFPALLLTLVSLPVLAFLVTSEPSPYDSELAFIEHSNNSQVLGSVIPASCESDPPGQSIPPNWDAPSPCYCAISAGACTGPSCTKTVTFATDFNPSIYGPWQMFRDGAYITSSAAPSASLNFTMTPAGSIFQIRRPDGVTICSAAVAGPPAPTLTFTASPNPINPGDSSTLNWSTTNATNCNAIGGWSGTKAVVGSESVTPSINTAYTLFCSGTGGTIPRSVTVGVNPPVLSLSASPTLVGPGNSSTLTWNVVGADTCTASGAPDWTGLVNATNGAHTSTVNPTVTTTYDLSCTGLSGTSVASAVVTMPSGFISTSPSPCEIPAEGISCNATVMWAGYNFLGPTASVRQEGTQFSSSFTGPATRPVTPSSTLFTLVDTGSAFVRNTNANVTCNPSSVWAGGMCMTLPIVTVTPDTEIVRSGSGTDVEIEVTSSRLLTCTFNDGRTGPLPTFNHDPVTAITTSHSLATINLTSAQRVIVTCTHQPFPQVTGSGTGRVNVIPTFQEI